MCGSGRLSRAGCFLLKYLSLRGGLRVARVAGVVRVVAVTGKFESGWLIVTNVSDVSDVVGVGQSVS